MDRDEFSLLLDAWLEPKRFQDVAENGLQVEGRRRIARVVCAVSASLHVIDHAIACGADAIVVHHGLVWSGGIRRLSGWLGERVRRLLCADVNLYAYHLPLDAHPELGNNAGIARELGLHHGLQPFGLYKGQSIGLQGAWPEPLSLERVVAMVTAGIGSPLAVVGEPGRLIQTIGICSGGAPDLLHEAIEKKLDCYLTGETTEWVAAIARETNTAFIAAGHHASERFGARALSGRLAQAGLTTSFVDEPNPA